MARGDADENSDYDFLISKDNLKMKNNINLQLPTYRQRVPSNCRLVFITTNTGEEYLQSLLPNESNQAVLH